MKRMITVFFFVLLLFRFSNAGLDMKQVKENKYILPQEYLNEKINKGHIPGIQYLVVDSQSVLFEFYGGWADIKNKKEMQPSTTMMAYSMTKTFTAAAIMQLFENKIINTEDPVSMYIPEIPYDREFTIRQLLTHTSGLPNPVPLRWVHLISKHDSYNENDELKKILTENDELKFEPGEKYKYSNIGYWLLGMIIEKASGKTYEEYMHTNVFKKLGFQNKELSYTILNPSEHAKGYLKKYSFFNLIKGFLIDRELIGEYETKWLHINNHYLNGPSFGGMIGSAKNISVFLQDQLKRNSVLFNADTKKLFYQQHVTNDNEPVKMTPGWHIGELNGQRYYFKEGGGGGYHCEMRVYPEKGTGTIIMVNRTSFNSNKVLNFLDNKN